MLVAQDLTLPCGLTLPNRLCKGAMAEGLAHDQNPSPQLLKTYEEWASGNWGMILTGNIMVSERYLGSPADVANLSAKSPNTQEIWKTWAKTCQANNTPTIAQLCHPGRQSPAGAGKRGFWDKTIAPSAVEMVFGTGLVERAAVSLIFGTPRAMTEEDIDEVVDEFVRAAKQGYDAGFKGVQLHGAHGYLLAQFLSPHTNLRTDSYGGSASARAKIVVRILEAIRQATSPEFCIGIKFNSVDVDTGTSDATNDAMTQIQMFINTGIDFIEISGGTYEKPTMCDQGDVKASTTARESFFLSFATQVRAKFPDIALMVTGGFRTRVGMELALKAGGCDLIGISRPAAVLPRLPKEIILNESVRDEDASVALEKVELPWWVKWIPIKQIGTGFVSVYYQGQIQRIGRGEKTIDTRIGVSV